MPFFTMAAATPRTASSETSQANLFQLFQPIGGVRARPLSMAGRVVVKRATYPKIANTRRFMGSTCLRWRVRPKKPPDAAYRSRLRTGSRAGPWPLRAIGQVPVSNVIRDVPGFQGHHVLHSRVLTHLCEFFGTMA